MSSVPRQPDASSACPPPVCQNSIFLDFHRTKLLEQDVIDRRILCEGGKEAREMSLETETSDLLCHLQGKVQALLDN